jgi:hypothetical protein
MDPIDNEIAVKYDTSLGGTDADDKTGLGGIDTDDREFESETTKAGPSKSTSPSPAAGLEGKDVLDLVGKKVDPTKKVEKHVKKQFEKHRDSLVDTVFEDANRLRAERLASGEAAPVTKKAVGMLNRLTNASGKASGSADSFVDGSAKKLISHLEKSSGVTRELLESGGDIARAIAGGTKNSKNLRIAGAATLFAAAGYGIGKVKGHAKDMRKQEQRVGPDEEQRLRQSLLNDG